MNLIEIIGLIATLTILISMCFKTSSFKTTLIMRSLNIVGSVAFVVYGALLPAISTAVLNGALVIVNSVHVGILIKQHKSKKTAQLNTNKNEEENEKNN